MKTRLTIPLLVIFLITCLARSVSTNVSLEKQEPAIVQTATVQQKKMVWHYYHAKTDTPWILVQKQKITADIPAPYYGGFEIIASLHKDQLRRLDVVCPHNKYRCTTYYIAQTHGFTTPHKLLKGKDYEWVNVRDITSSTNPDHGVWAHTRNGHQILICPMLVKALRGTPKPL